MAAESLHCPVLNGTVTRVTDLEGQVGRVICPELIQGSGLCRVRKRAGTGGPLSEFLERVSEHNLQMKGQRCVQL
jgi:hypothetical protein